MDKVAKKERRNLLLNKKRSKRRLTAAEMDSERIALRYKTIEMYEKGYVSDFVYKIGKKHNWFKINEDENEVIL